MTEPSPARWWSLRTPFPKNRISVDELVEQAFISREPTSSTRRFIEASPGDRANPVQYGKELNGQEGIKALVASRYLDSLEHAVRPEPQIGRLVAVSIHRLSLMRSLSLVPCAGSKLSPTARAIRAVFIAKTTV